MKVSEVNVVPIRPKDGLVAFASCVIDDSLYDKMGGNAPGTRQNLSTELSGLQRTEGSA